MLGLIEIVSVSSRTQLNAKVYKTLGPKVQCVSGSIRTTRQEEVMILKATFLMVV